MKSYLEHLQSVSNNQTFARKIAYIKTNYAKFIPSSGTSKLSILEIGPGTGEFVAYLNSLGITKIDVADIDKPVLNNIKSKFKISNAYTIKELTSKITEPKYDIILMLQVFEYIPRSQYVIFMKKLYSLLRAKGKIIITVPNGGNPLNLIERYHDLQHENAFTTDSLIELPNYCGINFKSITIEPFIIPRNSLVNLLRTLVQAILHYLIILMIIANGGVYQMIMTPNITAIYEKK